MGFAYATGDDAAEAAGTAAAAEAGAATGLAATLAAVTGAAGADAERTGARGAPTTGLAGSCTFAAGAEAVAVGLAANAGALAVTGLDAWAIARFNPHVVPTAVMKATDSVLEKKAPQRYLIFSS